MLELSIVIPVYNSEKTIGVLVEKLGEELGHLSFEIVLVNDGSRDKSAQICKQLTVKYQQVNFLNLRKNFGEFNAVMCGLNHINGRYAVIIDDDFQNPPSEILKLLNKAKEFDYDVVYSEYLQKKHSPFRNFGSRLINALNTYLIKKPKDLYLSSFKLINKEVVEEIVKYTGPYPYIDGLIFRVTNNIGTVLVEHSDRVNGVSNYSFRRLFNLFITIVFGYSLLPIRLVFLAGICSIFLSLMLIFGSTISSLNIIFESFMLFFIGFFLTIVSLLGEYIGKNYMTISGTPQYIIKDKILHKDAV